MCHSWSLAHVTYIGLFLTRGTPSRSLAACSSLSSAWGSRAWTLHTASGHSHRRQTLAGGRALPQTCSAALQIVTRGAASHLLIFLLFLDRARASRNWPWFSMHQGASGTSSEVCRAEEWRFLYWLIHAWIRWSRWAGKTLPVWASMILLWSKLAHADLSSYLYPYSAAFFC